MRGQAEYGGDAGIPSDPDNQTWNNFLRTSESNKTLNTSTGTSSSAKFTYTSDAIITASYEYVKFPTTDNQLMSGYVYSSTTDDYMTFTGLKANSQYTLYVYSQSEYTDGNNYGNDQKLELTINGGTPVTSSLSIGDTSTFVAGQNFLTTEVTTDASGKLVIAYDSPIGGNTVTNRGVINGLQLRGPATPEPASLVLLGIGGLLGARRLKKKSAKTSVPAV